ncbi:MAG: DotU family type IV/VI secretion system protein [Polyangiales bacterium]
MNDDEVKRRVRRARTSRAAAQTEAHGAIHDAVRPCLADITYLARRAPMPPNDVVFDHARAALQKAKLRLDGLGLDPRDREDVFYGLVAYIDEALQAEPGPLKEFWQAHLLQLEHFGETRAGEGFFERLARARGERRQQVVRAYYVCLLLGFRGIYGHHGELERENLIASVRDTLGAHDDLLAARVLSPFGARPDEPGIDRHMSRLVQSVAGAALAMAALWYVGLLFVVDARAHTLTEQLTSALADLRAGEQGEEP